MSEPADEPRRVSRWKQRRASGADAPEDLRERVAQLEQAAAASELAAERERVRRQSLEASSATAAAAAAATAAAEAQAELAALRQERDALQARLASAHPELPGEGIEAVVSQLRADLAEAREDVAAARAEGEALVRALEVRHASMLREFQALGRNGAAERRRQEQARAALDGEREALAEQRRELLRERAEVAARRAALAPDLNAALEWEAAPSVAALEERLAGLQLAGAAEAWATDAMAAVREGTDAREAFAREREDAVAEMRSLVARLGGGVGGVASDAADALRERIAKSKAEAEASRGRLAGMP